MCGTAWSTVPLDTLCRSIWTLLPQTIAWLVQKLTLNQIKPSYSTKQLQNTTCTWTKPNLTKPNSRLGSLNPFSPTFFWLWQK